MLTEIINLIDIHLFAFFICLIMLVDTKNRYTKADYSFRLFRFLVTGCMLILIMEAVSWAIDSRGNRRAVLLFDTVYFALQPAAVFFWGLYVDWHIEHDRGKVRRRVSRLLLPLIFCGGLLIANLFEPLVFRVTEEGGYQRATFFSLFMGICYSYLGYTLLRLWRYRHQLERQTRRTLFFFFLPPLAAGSYQAVYYGVSFVWPAVTISLLIVYIHLQNYRLSTDYLTGAYNRMQLDWQMQDRIVNGAGRLFAAILLDIDNFKMINDQFGHTTGDEALAATVAILRASLRRDDFLARYGGDEFLVIMDLDAPDGLQRAVDRIRKNLIAFNNNSGWPFKLQLSMGYDIYDHRRKMTTKQFLHYLDTKMYENKKTNRKR